MKLETVPYLPNFILYAYLRLKVLVGGVAVFPFAYFNNSAHLFFSLESIFTKGNKAVIGANAPKIMVFPVFKADTPLSIPTSGGKLAITYAK